MSSKNLIQIRAGAKAFGSRTLFSDATFAINEGEHVGVIGPNGAGKTTLFKAVMALAKEDELDEGEVTRAQGLRIGYLPQHDAATEKQLTRGHLENLSSVALQFQSGKSGRLAVIWAFLRRITKENSLR